MRILKVQNLMQRLPQSLIYPKHESVIGLKNTAKNASTQLIIKATLKNKKASMIISSLRLFEISFSR